MNLLGAVGCSAVNLKYTNTQDVSRPMAESFPKVDIGGSKNINLIRGAVILSSISLQKRQHTEDVISTISVGRPNLGCTLLIIIACQYLSWRSHQSKNTLLYYVLSAMSRRLQGMVPCINAKTPSLNNCPVSCFQVRIMLQIYKLSHLKSDIILFLKFSYTHSQTLYVDKWTMAFLGFLCSTEWANFFSIDRTRYILRWANQYHVFNSS